MFDNLNFKLSYPTWYQWGFDVASNPHPPHLSKLEFHAIWSLGTLYPKYSVSPILLLRPMEMMMKPWQIPLNKAPNKGGKKGTKREDPNPSQKSITQSWSLKGIGTNHVLEPPPITRNILERKKDGIFERVISFKKSSFAMIAHLKIEVEQTMF